MPPSSGRSSPSVAGKKIVDAAGALFVTHGYAATTVEMMAREAGVAVPTVYFSYRSKVNVLRALYDRDIAPLSEPEIVAGRRAAGTARAAAEAPEPVDAAERLRSHVAAYTRRNARAGRLVAMLHRAADVDGEAAELWRTDLEKHRAAQRRFVGVLRAESALAEGLRPQRAIDVLSALLGPDLYCQFVVERGWSTAEWERWTLRLLNQELFEPRTATTDGGGGERGRGTTRGSGARRR